jgi:outer membrane protein
MSKCSRRSRGRRANGGAACVVAAVCLAIALPHAAGAETLNEALAKAYSTNPDIAAAQSRLRQADETLSVANSNWRPSLAVTTNAERLSETIKDRTASTNDSYGSSSAEVEAVQPIFSSGRFGAIRRAARAQIRAERAQLRQVEQHVLLDTVKAFADVAVSETSFDLIRKDVTVLQDVLKQTSDRAQHHRATETDVEQTTAALDAARAECLSRQAKLLESWRTYQQLVGSAPVIATPASDSGVNACLDAKGERRRSTITLPDTLPAVPLSVEEVEKAALNGAPEIEFARAKEEEAQHATDAAYAELLPHAQLTARLSTDDAQANGPNTRTSDASITAEVRIPVFNGGAEWSAIRTARERRGEARLLVDGSERQGTRNAAAAWFELTSVQAIKLINKMQARAQEQAFEGMKAEISNPKLNRSTSDLLLQEHAVLSSQIALAQSDRDEAVAVYALLGATGKLNANDLQLAVSVYDVDANLKIQSGRWIGDSIFGE